MSNTAKFIPTLEFVENEPRLKFSKNIDLLSYQDQLRWKMIEITTYCMKCPDDHSRDYIDEILISIYIIVEEIEFKKALEQYRDKNYIEYEEHGFSRSDITDLIKHIYFMSEYLYLMKEVVQTPTYFEDPNKFYQKKADISDHILDFVNICERISIYKIMDILKEFKVSDFENFETEELIKNKNEPYPLLNLNK